MKTGRYRGLLGRLLGLLVLGLWIAADFKASLDVPLTLSGPTRLVVRKGDGIRQLANNLRQQGLLKEPLWLILDTLLRGEARSLKYGEYQLEPGMTPKTLRRMLVSGRSRQIPLTIIEGMRFKDLQALLKAHPLIRHETDTLSEPDIMQRLGESGLSPEGAFFPDTYYTSSNTSDLDLLKKARRKMQQLLEAAWAGRASGLPYQNSYEGLIMASIIEKETGLARERAAIAGVFVRRLQQGMRLQTDPTVIFGLGPGFDGDLRKEDLRRDTPYNTYLHGGLPPTPIAFPGQAALEAAFHPEGGNSLYFVARGDGGHVFSDTLDAHQRAVDRYQRKRLP